MRFEFGEGNGQWEFHAVLSLTDSTAVSRTGRGGVKAQSESHACGIRPRKTRDIRFSRRRERASGLAYAQQIESGRLQGRKIDDAELGA
jgi:hypothetical protein